ncbi:hypothetical protein D3C85_1619110 [compost metagenome]
MVAAVGRRIASRLELHAFNGKFHGEGFVDGVTILGRDNGHLGSRRCCLALQAFGRRQGGYAHQQASQGNTRY